MQASVAAHHSGHETNALLPAGLQPTEADQDRIDNGIAEAAAAKVYVAERSAELLEQHAEALMQAEIEFVR